MSWLRAGAGARAGAGRGGEPFPHPAVLSGCVGPPGSPVGSCKGGRVTEKTWWPRWRGDGGYGELLRLALPLILSSSFLTLQITIDRVLLSQYDSDTVAAALPAALLFWTPLTLLQNTAGYATTFVAQYLGAGRRQ